MHLFSMYSTLMDKQFNQTGSIRCSSSSCRLPSSPSLSRTLLWETSPSTWHFCRPGVTFTDVSISFHLNMLTDLLLKQINGVRHSKCVLFIYLFMLFFNHLLLTIASWRQVIISDILILESILLKEILIIIIISCAVCSFS